VRIPDRDERLPARIGSVLASVLAVAHALGPDLIPRQEVSELKPVVPAESVASVAPAPLVGAIPMLPNPSNALVFVVKPGRAPNEPNGDRLNEPVSEETCRRSGDRLSSRGGRRDGRDRPDCQKHAIIKLSTHPMKRRLADLLDISRMMGTRS
jgi:hypothetical protein